MVRLTAHIGELSEKSRLNPLIKALQSMRGISLIISAALAAEIVDFRRFDNPEKLMAYLGLIPSEHSSGDKLKKGPIDTSSPQALAESVLQKVI